MANSYVPGCVMVYVGDASVPPTVIPFETEFVIVILVAVDELNPVAVFVLYAKL
jgi:hypothetical protein